MTFTLKFAAANDTVYKIIGSQLVLSLPETTKYSDDLAVAFIEIDINNSKEIHRNDIVVSGLDAELFELKKGIKWELCIKADAKLDYKTNPSLHVRVGLVDSPIYKDFVVAVTPKAEHYANELLVSGQRAVGETLFLDTSSFDPRMFKLKSVRWVSKTDNSDVSDTNQYVPDRPGIYAVTITYDWVTGSAQTHSNGYRLDPPVTEKNMTIEINVGMPLLQPRPIIRQATDTFSDTSFAESDFRLSSDLL